MTIVSLEGAQATSLAEVFRLVAIGRAVTRSEIARVTGLARSTVGLRVDALRTHGLLDDGVPVESTGGRPAIGLAVGPRAGVVLGADLGATHMGLAVATLSGGILAESISEITIADGPEQVLGQVSAGFKALLRSAGKQATDVRSIGIGVPGPVEFHSGTVIRPPIMPGWDGARVPTYFADTFNAPVVVDNDVNVMAFGEYLTRDAGDAFILFVKIGTGIGCGIVSHGRVYRGADGAAGDIGHIKLPEDDETICSCGNIGCVEAVASGSAIARELAAAGEDATTSYDVVRLALEGNPIAVRGVRRAATQIGEVVASLVNFHNPSLIVVGGPLAPLQYDLLAGIRAVVYKRATPLATRTLAIEASWLDDRSGVVGAVGLASEHVLSPAGLQHLIKVAQ